MDKKSLKMSVTIKTKTDEMKREVGTTIHKQLVGNKDYIDSNIILNIDHPCEVQLLVFDECEKIPSITI